MSARPVAAVAMFVALLGSVACSASPGASGAPGTTVATTATSTTDPGLDPAKIEGTVKEAVLAASAVHVKGTMASKNQTIGLDLQLNSDSASGTITQGGVATPVMLVDKVYYVRFTADVLKAGGVSPTSAASAKLVNKWVPSTSSALNPGMLKELQTFLSYSGFIQQTFGTLDSDKIVTSGTDNINGVPVVVYKNLTHPETSDITAASPHYVLRVTSTSGQTTGTLDLTGWNQPVAVTLAPKSEIYSS